MHRVMVVGLGLMGMSLGWRLQEAGYDVAGYDPDGQAMAFAAAHGVHPPDQKEPPDLAVLAVPLSSLPAAIEKWAPTWGENTLVTDLSSVKAPVMPWLSAIADPVSVIGSHPMAGSAGQSFAAASPDLYHRRPWAVVPVPGRPFPAARLEHLLAPLEVRFVTMEAAQHDQCVAYTSHLPYLVSMALVSTMEQAPAGWQDLIGPGLLSAVRTAASPPELWTEILSANCANVQRAESHFAKELTTWQVALDQGTFARRIARSRDQRLRWPTASPLNPPDGPPT